MGGDPYNGGGMPLCPVDGLEDTTGPTPPVAAPPPDGDPPGLKLNVDMFSDIKPE